MLILLLSLAVAASSPADSLESPPVVIRAAVHAIEGDSASALRSRWERRLAKTPTDWPALLGLASLARLTYDYPGSDSLRRSLLAHPLVPRRYALYALLEDALAIEAQGYSDSAAAALGGVRDSARAAGDREAEGEALVWLSTSVAYAEGIERGLALLDRAERLLPDDALELRAERLRRRAGLRAVAGVPGAAADAADAVALARHSGSVRAEAQALRAVGQVLYFQGARDSANAVLRRAEALYRRGRDHGQLATAMLWRVNALTGHGELGEALELSRQALEEGRAARSSFAVASAHIALGGMATMLNDQAAAARHFREAVTLARRLRDRSTEMKARDYLVVTALASGDLEGARRQAMEVLAWYRGTGEWNIELSTYRNLAVIAAREGDWAAARRALADAEALVRRVGHPRLHDELAYDRGRLAVAQGALDRAERELSRYLATLDSSQHVFRHDTRIRLADVHARRGDLARAEREALTAWDELERWRAGLTDAELRVLAFQASPSEANDRDAILVHLLAALVTGGRVERAFELAERRRARELVDRLAKAGAWRETGAGPPALAPSGQGRLEVPTLGARAVAELIPDDRTAVLAYVTGALGAPTVLFVLAPGLEGGVPVRAHVLPPADSLARAVARLAASVETGEPLAAPGRALAAALVEPAVRDIGWGVTHLVILPDGPLHEVPFDVLPMSAGPLVERYAVSLAPSASVLATLWRGRRAEPREGPVRLLAFGDPAPARHQLAESLPGLPAAALEAKVVARFADSASIRLGPEASAAYLKSTDLTRYGILHFATHALVDERSAARPALVLAPGEGESGLVTPADLATLRLDADLVVLSACRSADGVVVGGEGMQGLTAPLLGAGARSVVATHWRVGDRSTLRLVRGFYQELARGRSVGEALRATKLAAWRDGMPARDWAAFVVIGDPLLRVRLRAPAEVAGLQLLSGALIVVVVVGGLVAGVRWKNGARRSHAR